MRCDPQKQTLAEAASVKFGPVEIYMYFTFSTFLKPLTMHPTGSSDIMLYLPSEIQRIKANTKLIAFIFHLTGLPQLTHEAGVQSWDKGLSILLFTYF